MGIDMLIIPHTSKIKNVANKTNTVAIAKDSNCALVNVFMLGTFQLSSKAMINGLYMVIGTVLYPVCYDRLVT